jgi:hypothetical protein
MRAGATKSDEIEYECLMYCLHVAHSFDHDVKGRPPRARSSAG